MLIRLLFDTRVGDWLLAQFERRSGLALVSADWLGDQHCRSANKNGPADVEGQPVPVDGDGESPVQLSIAGLGVSGKVR